MVLVAARSVKTATLASSKILQGTRRVVSVPLGTVTSFSAAPPVATLSHLDPTVGTEKYASVTMDSFALVVIRIRQRVRLDDIRLHQDPLTVLTARLANTQR